MAPTSGEDALRPLRELARRAGVAEGTLRRWANEVHPPLQVRRNKSGRITGSSVADLRVFCAEHSGLRAARRAQDRLNHPVGNVDAGTLRAVLGAVLAAVRTATAAQLDLARTGAGQARAAAVTCQHHETELTIALGGLDDALSRIAPPSPDLR